MEGEKEEEEKRNSRENVEAPIGREKLFTHGFRTKWDKHKFSGIQKIDKERNRTMRGKKGNSMNKVTIEDWEERRW